MQVNVLEARNRLSQLLGAVQDGETVIIANRGRPVARLVPAGIDTDPVPNGSRLLDGLRENPLPAHLQRDHAAVEDGIRTERDGWD